VTGKNKLRNAAAELERANECLREAQTLLASSFAYGVASRAYYAVFHGTRALLFSIGVEPRSHRAAMSLLGEHFVKTGLLSPAMARTAARMQRDREDADYMTEAVFTLEQARELIAAAQGFLAEVRGLLSSPQGAR